jgi:hypothetical protein
VQAGQQDAVTASFSPRGTLRIEIVGGGEQADVADGSNLPEDTQVAFMTRVEGADYLYLLQKSNAGVEVLHPSTGQVFINEGGEQRIVPHRPNEDSINERRPGGYSGAGTGVFEYILVASPVPRDFPSNSQVETTERMLAPPPYVEGYAALPAVIVASIKVIWGVPDL